MDRNKLKKITRKTDKMVRREQVVGYAPEGRIFEEREQRVYSVSFYL